MNRPIYTAITLENAKRLVSKHPCKYLIYDDNDPPKLYKITSDRNGRVADFVIRISDDKEKYEILENYDE